MVERCGSTIVVPTERPTYIRCLLKPDHEAMCRAIMPGVCEFRAPNEITESISTVRVMLTWKAA